MLCLKWWKYLVVLSKRLLFAHSGPFITRGPLCVQAVWKPWPKTEVRTSTQNLELIDWLVEPNFTYERGFQLCFWQFQRPKKFSHNLCQERTFHTSAYVAKIGIPLHSLRYRYKYKMYWIISTGITRWLLPPTPPLQGIMLYVVPV